MQQQGTDIYKDYKGPIDTSAVPKTTANSGVSSTELQDIYTQPRTSSVFSYTYNGMKAIDALIYHKQV